MREDETSMVLLLLLIVLLMMMIIIIIIINKKNKKIKKIIEKNGSNASFQIISYYNVVPGLLTSNEAKFIVHSPFSNQTEILKCWPFVTTNPASP